ncbi:MAG: hypothetical protein II448_05260, partial [Paludibacteraceae bacterium]|nr:hypothetical protein [Paludibacteraceae bacterium]
MNWLGGAHQTREYRAQTGEDCWWTNSMFSGMPTYQIDSHLPSHDLSNHVLRDVLHLGLNETMGILFGYFLCFFILLLCFGVNPWISIAGALAMGMSSYFFLLIPAGHVTKAMALGFLPAIIGGVHLVFKQKYWLGIPIMLIFGIVSITLHPQMTYYVAMLIGVMTIVEIFIKIKDLEWKNLSISLAVCIACLAFVVGSRVCYLKINNEYLHETMRGGHSELTKNDTTSTSKVGLDLTYATDWSYGRAETMTLLIPNWEGGASGYNVGK